MQIMQRLSFPFKPIRLFLTAVTFGFTIITASADTLKESDRVDSLEWTDLMPAGYKYQSPLDLLTDEQFLQLTDDSETAMELMAELDRINRMAPVVESLDDKNVQITGYIVPLDFNAEEITEFLLVPYFGACIHTPPPPANQIVYVKADEPVKLDNIWDPYIITGLLKVEASENEISPAGYTLLASDAYPDLVGDFEEKWFTQ